MEEKTINEVQIPDNILYHKKIIANAKLLYYVIAKICKQDGYCIKLNLDFAELFGVSSTSISLWVKSLQKNRTIQCIIIKKYIRVIFLQGTSKEYIKGVLSKLKDNTSYYMREHIDTPAVDDFNIETKEWVDDNGVKHGRDLIDYE